MRLETVCWAGRVLRKLGNELLERGGVRGTWIDVGAHHGELTMVAARRNPGLRVFAIEPNLRAAAKMMGNTPNYIVIPVAIAEEEGTAELHVNALEMASSLLAVNEEARKTWIGVEELRVEATVNVPTMRLDGLMERLEIEKVDFLKIDAQGMDLAVLRSAGARLKDIDKIQLEVEVAPLALYVGSPSKEEVVSFLEEAGFALVEVEKQTHGQEENLTFVRMGGVAGGWKTNVAQKTMPAKM